MANFRIVQNATFWWPVKWNEVRDGGVVEEVRIELKFTRVPTDEYAAVMELQNREFVDRVVQDWRHVAGPDGQPVPFSDPWIGMWLQLPRVPQALGEAFFDFMAAIPETRQGNSESSPAGGPAEAAETAAPTATTTP